MTSIHKYDSDFTLLLESGFIAVSQFDEDSALKLFQAAHLLQGSNTLPKIGFGYIHLLKLELPQATKNFEEVLKIEPQNEMASALLGFSIALTIKDVVKGEKILHDVLKKTQDKGVKTMVATTLDFIEKFIKKPTTPLQTKPNKPAPKHKKKRKK